MCGYGNQLTLATVGYSNQADKETAEFSFWATVHSVGVERWKGSRTPAPVKIDIAVGPTAQLTWLAYSNQGNLCAMDSNGQIFIGKFELDNIFLYIQAAFVSFRRAARGRPSLTLRRL